NCLFSGNDGGAEDNCIFYTLLGSCLQAGVEPLSWLGSTLQTIPTLQTPIDWQVLLPDNYKPTKEVAHNHLFLTIKTADLGCLQKNKRQPTHRFNRPNATDNI
ncbi:MAG: hypothetical protein LBJ01_02515, partial [Tannerella sp.]|nr:hypothetical protein [Tannerella sp.]